MWKVTMQVKLQESSVFRKGHLRVAVQSCEYGGSALNIFFIMPSHSELQVCFHNESQIVTLSQAMPPPKVQANLRVLLRVVRTSLHLEGRHASQVARIF